MQEKKNAIGGISSAIAAMVLKKRLDEGKSISIPGLGIVIEPKKDDAPPADPDAQRAAFAAVEDVRGCY